MSKKGSVLIALLLLTTIVLGAVSTTVAAQELVEMTQEETQDAEEMNNLWDFSAGVATIVNPTPEASSEEENLRVREFIASYEEEAEADSVEAEYGIVMSDADHTLDIVAHPEEDAEVVGFLYEDCGGKVIEQSDGWTLLQSGDLVGWTKDENLAFEEEAYAMASEVGRSVIVVEAGALRARTAPGADAEVAAVFAHGEELDLVEEIDAEWLAVDHNNEVVYVNAAYVSRDFSVDTGETVAAIEKREEEKRLEEERKAAEAAQLEEEEARKREEEARKIEEAKAQAQAEAAAAEAALIAQAAAEAEAARVSEAQAAEMAAALEAQAALEAAQRAAATQAAAAAATVDDIRFLGALIYCEAGNQPYEGKVAVGAVVMNRVKSPRYPNTIEGVIRASGQFTPVRSGKVDRIYAQGAPEECILAAQEALAGVSPVGDATHFRRNNGREGQVIGAHVFY